jgi:8-amino-7-oxononanoate synthase
MSKTQITELFDAELQELAANNLLRRLPPLSAHSATSISVGERQCLLLCSNNYLGIADHPKMREAAVEAAKENGCSASASRLVSGNLDLYGKLESALAEFIGKEDALVFSSGYAANAGILQSVAGSGDVILSDEFNHASIVDGCRLSKADKKLFRHNDLQDLEKHLKQCSAYRKRLIAVEGVYSLDGDVPPLAEIVEVARRYDCALMVDEAHAVGVLGENGCGAGEFHGVTHRVDIIMGTFGKALGSYGAFVAGSTQLKQLLVNKARSLIYTTALPPAVLAATLAALEVVRSEPWRRHDVLEKAAYLRDGLSKLGFNVGTSMTQIVPVIVGDAARAVRLSELLLEEGVFVQAIRPPSVPPGKSRLRVTVNAEHTYDQLDTALAAFTQAEKFLSKTRRGAEG